jgi:hypothetical protein
VFDLPLSNPGSVSFYKLPGKQYIAQLGCSHWGRAAWSPKGSRDPAASMPGDRHWMVEAGAGQLGGEHLVDGTSGQYPPGAPTFAYEVHVRQSRWRL